jgi:hypothetical protein
MDIIPASNARGADSENMQNKSQKCGDKENGFLENN